MNKIISFFIVFLSSILILSSCKISKHAIRKKSVVDSSTIVHQKFVLDSMANQALLDQYKAIWNQIRI